MSMKRRVGEGEDGAALPATVLKGHNGGLTEPLSQD